MSGREGPFDAAPVERLVEVVKERLNDGESAIHNEFICSSAEAAELRREFQEAEDALAELARRASRG